MTPPEMSSPLERFCGNVISESQGILRSFVPPKAGLRMTVLLFSAPILSDST